MGERSRPGICIEQIPERVTRQGTVFRLCRFHVRGDVVQLVRTLPCHGRGREFESRRPRHLIQALCVIHWNPLTLGAIGLSPTTTQGLIQLDERGELVASCLREL
jgi:hypothetical protein